MAIYRIAFTIWIVFHGGYAQEIRRRTISTTSHENYQAALVDEKASNPFDEIEKFTADDTIKQDQKGRTVAMDLLSKGKYGLLSPLLNRALCHLIRVTPVESLFNIWDHEQRSLFFYIAKNSELTEDTIGIIMHKVLYEDAQTNKKRKKSKKYISIIVQILETPQEQFDPRIVGLLQSHCVRRQSHCNLM